MDGKIGVHELAKELGVPIKDVLDRLNGQGVIARSGASTVSKRVARWLRDSYRIHGGEKLESSVAVERPDVYVVSAHPRADSKTTPQEPKRPRIRPDSLRRSGIPFVSKEEQIAKREAARKRITDPEKVRKRVMELNGRERPRPKTEAEKASDEAARESMRSHKPSSWRVGRSPGTYG